MKWLLPQLIIMIICSVTHAQEYGLTGGVNSISVSSDLDTDSKLGYRFGVLTNFNLNEEIFLTTGLLYADRSFETSEAPDTNLKFDIAYVDIPLLLNFKITEIFNLHLGPVVAFNVKEKAKGTILGFNYNGDISDIDDSGFVGPVGNMKKIYTFIQAGASFDFSPFSAVVFYERGLGEIYAKGPKNYSQIGTNLSYWF